MEFWHETLTQKSWNILLDLKKKSFTFILIGGWAAYLWTRLHKSKDVDIVLQNMTDLDFLKGNYALKKNDSLKKYEISFEDIDVDIYVPYYSKLAIPPEDLKKFMTRIEGIDVAIPEALLVLKQGAEEDREHSIKGEKDRIDIMALVLFANVNFKKYDEILSAYKLVHYRQRLKHIIAAFKSGEYLGLNLRELTLRKKELLEKLG
ncbi:MAG: hypothetical protein V1743_00500 [Nanoarchaeota archaeon]